MKSILIRIHCIYAIVGLLCLMPEIKVEIASFLVDTKYNLSYLLLSTPVLFLLSELGYYNDKEDEALTKREKKKLIQKVKDLGLTVKEEL
jgi:hypothetical protein